MLNWRDYVELILFSIHSPDYLFTAGKYSWSNHVVPIIIFVVQKKVVFVRFELTTFTL